MIQQFTIPKLEIYTIFKEFFSKGSSIYEETQVTGSHFSQKSQILLCFSLQKRV